MDSWQIWCIAGILLLILEMFTPVIFFINLAFAAFVTAIFSYLGFSFLAQSVLFSVFSIIFILFLRPLMVKKIKTKNHLTGINGQYIDHEATVVEEVTKNNGRIALYGEEWNAKTLEDEVIPIGSKVRIKSNDSLIMYVEKIKE